MSGQHSSRIFNQSYKWGSRKIRSLSQVILNMSPAEQQNETKKKNLKTLAENFLFSLRRNKFIEKELHENCVKTLGLSLLTKDDSVDPDRMIECLKRILDADIRLNNCNLHITHYYSVLSDGTMCIPWDWTFEWINGHRRIITNDLIIASSHKSWKQSVLEFQKKKKMQRRTLIYVKRSGCFVIFIT